MGEAKRRGTYEERKAAAIKSQQEKIERGCFNCKYSKIPVDKRFCYMCLKRPEDDYCPHHLREGERRRPPGRSAVKLAMLIAATSVHETSGGR